MKIWNIEKNNFDFDFEENDFLIEVLQQERRHDIEDNDTMDNDLPQNFQYLQHTIVLNGFMLYGILLKCYHTTCHSAERCPAELSCWISLSVIL